MSAPPHTSYRDKTKKTFRTRKTENSKIKTGQLGTGSHWALGRLGTGSLGHWVALGNQWPWALGRWALSRVGTQLPHPNLNMSKWQKIGVQNISYTNASVKYKPKVILLA